MYQPYILLEYVDYKDHYLFSQFMNWFKVCELVENIPQLQRLYLGSCLKALFISYGMSGSVDSLLSLDKYHNDNILLIYKVCCRDFKQYIFLLITH